VKETTLWCKPRHGPLEFPVGQSASGGPARRPARYSPVEEPTAGNRRVAELVTGTERVTFATPGRAGPGKSSCSIG
jgi:hypothetical protein